MLKSKIVLSAFLTGGLLVIGSLLDSTALSSMGVPRLGQTLGLDANVQSHDQANHNDEATAQRLLAEGRQMLLKDPEASLIRLQSALKIYRQHQNTLGQQETLDAIGSTYLFLGDLPQAVGGLYPPRGPLLRSLSCIARPVRELFN